MEEKEVINEIVDSSNIEAVEKSIDVNNGEIDRDLLIEIENVKKTFGKNEVLKGITFNVRKGEVIAFNLIDCTPYSFYYGKTYDIKNGKVSNIKEKLIQTTKWQKIEKNVGEIKNIATQVPMGGPNLSRYYDEHSWTGD